MKSIHHLDADTTHKITSHANFDGVQAVVEALVVNSINAGANKVTIKIDIGSLSVSVEDDGKGIGERTLLAIAGHDLPGHSRVCIQNGFVHGKDVQNSNAPKGRGVQEIPIEGEDSRPYLYSPKSKHMCLTTSAKGIPGSSDARIADMTPQAYCTHAPPEITNGQESLNRHSIPDSHKTAPPIMGYKGASMRTLLGLCSNFIIASATHQENNVAFSSANSAIINVLMDYFGNNFPVVGTVVIVSRLFCDTPVRSKYVKQNLKRENLELCLKRMVFSRVVEKPSLNFKLGFVSKKSLEWSFDSVSHPKSLFVDFFGDAESRQLECSTSDFHLEGAFSASENSTQLFFFNGQLVILSQKQKASLRTVFSPSPRQLSYFISVRHQHSDSLTVVWPTLLDTIQDLLHHKSTPSPRKKRSVIPFDDSKSKYFQRDITIDENDLDESRLHIISQVNNSFVLASSGTKLLAVDPHACDERVRLETLLKEFIEMAANPEIDLRVPVNSQLDFPLSALQASYFKRNHQRFIAFGIDYSVAPDRLMITHLNHYLLGTSSSHLKDRMLQHFRQHSAAKLEICSNWVMSTKNIPKYIFEGIATQACRSSVKLGQTLTTQEILHIVNSLKSCHLPFQCAHGRPTIIPLPKDCSATFDLDYIC